MMKLLKTLGLVLAAPFAIVAAAIALGLLAFVPVGDYIPDAHD